MGDVGVPSLADLPFREPHFSNHPSKSNDVRADSSEDLKSFCVITDSCICENLTRGSPTSRSRSSSFGIPSIATTPKRPFESRWNSDLDISWQSPTPLHQLIEKMLRSDGQSKMTRLTAEAP